MTTYICSDIHSLSVHQVKHIFSNSIRLKRLNNAWFSLCRTQILSKTRPRDPVSKFRLCVAVPDIWAPRVAIICWTCRQSLTHVELHINSINQSTAIKTMISAVLSMACWYLTGIVYGRRALCCYLITLNLEDRLCYLYNWSTMVDLTYLSIVADCPELIEYSQSTRQFFFPRVLREKIEYDRKKLLNLIINENRKKFPGLISPG